MHFKKASLFIFLAVLATTGSRAHSQASVTENQTTYIYVDAAKGSDSNSGSSSAPVKTIQAAVNKANANNQKRLAPRSLSTPVYTVNRFPSTPFQASPPCL